MHAAHLTADRTARTLVRLAGSPTSLAVRRHRTSTLLLLGFATLSACVGGDGASSTPTATTGDISSAEAESDTKTAGIENDEDDVEMALEASAAVNDGIAPVDEWPVDLANVLPVPGVMEVEAYWSGEPPLVGGLDASTTLHSEHEIADAVDELLDGLGWDVQARSSGVGVGGVSWMVSHPTFVAEGLRATVRLEADEEATALNIVVGPDPTA